ncbi:hypothetical protein BC835DRAFT_1017212 [Cytidiella melzeri]|nr:hypothetical protein BC835DRAFT_1017212 [Cytidiella melzeri]
MSRKRQQQQGEGAKRKLKIKKGRSVLRSKVMASSAVQKKICPKHAIQKTKKSPRSFVREKEKRLISVSNVNNGKSPIKSPNAGKLWRERSPARCLVSPQEEK